MELSIWLSFVGAAIILTITPGPSVLLATANSMKYGKGKTIGTIAGDLTANLCQIILASIGLATIIISSGELFQIIKWCGVVYLIFIGITKIMVKPQMKLSSDKNESSSFSKLFTEGFLMSAANPKAIVFFAAFFPLFLNETIPIIPQIVILAITFLMIDGLSLFIYAIFAEKLKFYLENQEKVHLQNRIVGGLLILSGIMLSMVKKTNN